MRIETRAIATEARAAGEDGGREVTGLGIVYDSWAEIWPGYRERINRGAVKQAETVKSFFNHDPSNVLSTLSSTPPLKLRETEKGLEYISPIPPTSYGRDLEINLERGNVRGSSFAFSVPKRGDRVWEDEAGIMHREITELTLYEVGPVTDPAYITTTAAVRSAREVIEEWRAAQKPQIDHRDHARIARHRLMGAMTGR